MDMLDNKIKKILSQNIVEPITYEKAINEALYYKKKHKIKEYITKVIIMIFYYWSINWKFWNCICSYRRKY